MLFLLSAVLALTLNGQSTTGSILGDVTDASGARMPGATVRLINEGTGATREALSNEVGAYRFDALQPVEYTVSVEFAGFTTVTRKNIKVPVATQVKVDFALQVATTSETITVNEQVPVVETTENAIKTLVDNQRIENLPLKSRDFMSLALLAPGVVMDQTVANNASTGLPPISFGGVSSRYKSIWFEGVDFNDEVTGGGSQVSQPTRTTIAQEAIQEFQVMANSYSAEFGRSASGVINIVTKSGTNDFHGNAFYFLRDDKFAKQNYFGSLPYRSQQYGATLGGPVIKDKVHFFGSLEGRKQHSSIAVLIPPQLVNFAKNLGYDTTSSAKLPIVARNYFGKLSYTINPKHTFTATYLRDFRDAPGTNVGGSVAADSGWDDFRHSYFLLGNLTSLLGSNLVNELRVNRSDQYLIRVPPYESPTGKNGCASALGCPGKVTLRFPSVTLGADGMQGRHQINKILSDSMSFHVRNHSLKWGFSMDLVPAYSVLNGNTQGTYQFASDVPVNPNDPSTLPFQYTQGLDLRNPPPLKIGGFGYSALRRDTSIYDWFINDSWRVRSNFTLNIGFRYDLYLYKGDLNGLTPPKDIPPEVFWVNLVQGRYFGQNFKPVPVDYNAPGPRFGFSWDPTKDGKTVIRGGWGIYRYHFFMSTLRSIVAGYPGFINTNFGNNTRLTGIPNNFFPNRPPRSALSEQGSTSFNIPTVEVKGARLPYTQQYTLGFSREIARNLGVSADYSYLFGLHFPMQRNVNARLCPTCGFPLIASGTQMSVYDGSDILQIHNVQFRIEKKFSNKLGFLASYVWGRGNSYGGGGLSSSAAPSNNYDLKADWGPIDNDVHHRITGNVMYEIPFGIQLGGFVQFNSAPPYNITTGLDDNRDLVVNDRPAGTKYNAGRADRFFNLDVRISKKFNFNEKSHMEVMWEMFNTFNTVNFFSNYVGNMRAANFGKPGGAFDPFQGQLGLRFTF